MSLAKLTVCFVFASVVIDADSLPHESLITHEWGTFTSVAGPDGSSIQWAPLAQASDLPCFVERIHPRSPKTSLGLVRMETPVLYFYPPRAMTLSVHVDFPQGWITEWYPRASAIGKTTEDFTDGHIEWNSVKLSPGADPQFPSGQGASHYYAARNTDSAPLRIGDQQEKLLFYRGIGNFPIPLKARFDTEGRLEIRSAGVPWAIVFENRSGKVGYRLVRGVTDKVTVDPPELTADLENLRNELADTLVAFGLYRKEALAMVETWRDSWFEEGSRVFYIVPRATVDATLPLTITPAPDAIARVFVGRVELLSPHVEDAIATALGNGDTATLAKFGRFLDPFINQIHAKNPAILQAPAVFRYLQESYQKRAKELLPVCAENRR